MYFPYFSLQTFIISIFQFKQFQSPFIHLLLVPMEIMTVILIYLLSVMGDFTYMTRIKLIFQFYLVYWGQCHLVFQSEQLDECYSLVRTAVYQSFWYKLSVTNQKLLCLMIRQAQEPNHFKFMKGLSIINNRYILNITRTYYSIVNCIRLMKSGRS